MDLKKYIRSIPDYPKKGILFRDITTLIKDKDAFKECIDQMSNLLTKLKFDKIASIESRGFVFASALCYNLSKSLILMRKKNKLPADRYSQEFELEYGKATIEIHKDSIQPKEQILIIDDFLLDFNFRREGKFYEEVMGAVFLFLKKKTVFFTQFLRD